MAGQLSENSWALPLLFGWIIFKTRKLNECLNEDFSKKRDLFHWLNQLYRYGNLSHQPRDRFGWSGEPGMRDFWNQFNYIKRTDLVGGLKGKFISVL